MATRFGYCASALEDAEQSIQNGFLQSRHGIELACVEPHPFASRALVHLDVPVIHLDQPHAAFGAFHVMERLETFFFFHGELFLLFPFAWLLRPRPPPFVSRSASCATLERVSRIWVH